MVEARRNEDKVEERHDLFSSLLDATQDELGSEAVLDDDELIGEYQTPRSIGNLGKRLIRVPGNMFIYLLAGHEVGIFSVLPAVLSPNSSLQTSAHALCFSFALLALYPDEQERLYQHIKGVMSSLDGMPVGSRYFNSYRELTFP